MREEMANIEQLINMEPDSDSNLALQFYRDGFNLLFTNLIDLTNQEIRNKNERNNEIND